MPPRSPTVVVGCLEPLLRRGVVATLREHSMSVLCDGVPARQLVAVVSRRAPEIVVLDDAVDYPILARLTRLDPRPGLLVLAAAPRPLLRGALLADAAVCVPRGATSEHLLAAAARAIEPGLRTAAAFRREPRHPPGGLTEREAEVFAQLSMGLTYVEIGARLHVSSETVRTHTRNICRKLGVRTRLELLSQYA